ncbi:MAG: fibro-slime domain-containing protein [Fibrobacteres bacterium]|nr:fibro-slime domain-containing protein [Fibrobacterota bacterium]
MLKPWSTPLSVFVMVACFAAVVPAHAQAPADSLGGKTVHVFLPLDDIDSLVIQNVKAGLTKDAEYWYSYTFTKSGLYDNPDGFYFTDPYLRSYLSKDGLGVIGSPRFTLPDFQGKKEIWIIIDPTAPPTARPYILTRAPKLVNILNPWSATAPKLISGTKTRNMTTISGHCGWFSAMILDTTMTGGHFAEIGDAGTYGKSGFGAGDDFDFAALFAQYGPTPWLNTDAKSWTAAFPNVEGTCRYMLSMTVRDFSKDHPNFDFEGGGGDGLVQGIVMPDIGPEPGRKPVLNPAIVGDISFSHFDDWWVTDSTRPPPLQNYESCYDLPMGKSREGQWEYDSNRDSPDHGFWPVEGALNRFNETSTTCYYKPVPDTDFMVTNGPARNGNFCAESHADFTYAPGQKISVRGDDDVWVFINGKLVIDLGGVHLPADGSADLDTLGLIAGKTYKWDFFYCERQPCGSDLLIKTAINFRQQRSLYGIAKTDPTTGPFTLEVWKRVGGNGSCASTGTKTDSLKASNLTYQLLDLTGKLVKELANGKTYFGGITIAEPVISVDTAKLITDSILVPGSAYRVVAFEAANPTLQVSVSFRTRNAGSALRKGKNPAAESRSGVRYRNILGRRVPVGPSRAQAPLIPQKIPRE